MGGSALTPLAFRRPIMVPPYLTLDFNAPPAIRRVRYTVLGLGIVALLAGGMELAVAWQSRAQAHAELASLDKRHMGAQRPVRVPDLSMAPHYVSRPPSHATCRHRGRN